MGKGFDDLDVQRIYDVLAKIIGDSEGLNIKFTVRRRDDCEEENI